MSSHREAPGISKDPVADNTDVYAFVSPDRPDTVTIIANYIPLEYPPGGPNFFEFGDDVTYAINIDNDGDGEPDISYRFRFTTDVRNEDTFLYNTGPISSLDSSNWNRRQFFDVVRRTKNGDVRIGESLACPPCNIGPRSTPNYPALASAAIHDFQGGLRVFAGQRNDGFYVDLGSIFDLLDLRPFQNLHLIPSPAADGVDGLRGFNVHTIAIQVPKSHLVPGPGGPTDPDQRRSVIGVWATASRQKSTIHETNGSAVSTGPWVQVSRLGNPLFNEVIVPLGEKDGWNALPPSADSRFAKYVRHPEVAALLPVLYPGVFPNLEALSAPRKDLVAILLTGLPKGVIPGFQNFTGDTPADVLRLNMSVPPSSNPNVFGILGGDLAGFPNGRRPQDNVVAIELRAIAGATYPLIDPNFTPDPAASQVTDGTSPSSDPVPFMRHFPYLGTPNDGFDTTPPS
jgi:Domain of unknown function (DUF4331)